MEIQSSEINTKKVHRLFLFIFIHMILFLLISSLLLPFGVTITSYIGAISAMLPIYFAFFKEGSQTIKTYATHKITPKRFVTLVIILFGINFLSGLLVTAITYILELLGLPSPNLYADIQQMLTSSKWIILYGIILGPIIEEIVYRGILFGVLEKYGQTTALIVSSIIFGLMHDNLEQSISTFFIGMVLGYICMRYGLKYAIIFHIINNLFAMSVGSATNIPLQTIISILLLTAAIVTIVLYIRNREKVHDIFRLGSKELHHVIIRSPFFWIVVITHVILITLAQLTPLFMPM